MKNASSIVWPNPVFFSVSVIELTDIWAGFGLFFIALFSFFVGRIDLIRLLITFEIMFLANIILFSLVTNVLGYFGGYTISLILLAVAAVETGIGLGLLIRAYVLYGTAELKRYNQLRAK